MSVDTPIHNLVKVESRHSTLMFFVPADGSPQCIGIVRDEEKDSVKVYRNGELYFSIERGAVAGDSEM